MITIFRYLRNAIELISLHCFGRKTFLSPRVKQDVLWQARLEDDFKNNVDLERNDAYYRKFFEEIVTLIGSEREATELLEIGCYYGRRTNLLALRFPEKSFTGTDLNDQNVRFGQERLTLAPNVRLLEADALKLPFSDNSFDVVYSVVSVSHMSHDIVAPVLRELTRVCRRTVILVEVDLFAWPVRKQISAAGIGYMYFHDYLAIAKAHLHIQKVVRLHCGEAVPRYSAFVFSKKSRVE